MIAAGRRGERGLGRTHTCPSPAVPAGLLQLHVEAGLLIILLMVDYSNRYGLPAGGGGGQGSCISSQTH